MTWIIATSCHISAINMPSDLFSKLIFAICKLLAGPCSCMQPPASPTISWAYYVAHSFWALPVGGFGWRSCFALPERCPNLGGKCNWHEYDRVWPCPTKNNSRSRSSSQVPTNSSKSIAPFLSTSSSTHSVLPCKTAWGISALKSNWNNCFVSSDPHRDIYFGSLPSHILPDINSDIYYDVVSYE